MEQENRNALIGLPIVIVVAAAVAWAGSQNGGDVPGVPIFALAVALAFTIQWLAFILAYALRTELFYDLTGSLTYISITILAALVSPVVDDRTVLLVAVVLIWATRLGTFLFGRIMKTGEDERFDTIKTSFLRFLLTWTVQGLWVTFTAAAAWAAITAETRRPLGWFALMGFLIWAFGFGFEVLADAQKSAFKADPSNDGDFIDVGLWRWSRHPNYFGEIVLWVGAAIIAFPVLRGWQLMTLISPLYVTAQLVLVSGIPILEKRADERWGGEEDYEAYKERTPVLIPRPPSSGGRKD
jgi:steroid 5-alpha reductase family enzyme